MDQQKILGTQYQSNLYAIDAEGAASLARPPQPAPSTDTLLPPSGGLQVDRTTLAQRSLFGA